jgi:formylmethanofuran dehydrogenase subunit E
MTRENLTCERCGKRLSRKTARQIDGVVMCSTCMFKPPAKQGDPA